MTTDQLKTNKPTEGGSSPSAPKSDDPKGMVFYVFDKNVSTFVRDPDDKDRSILMKVQNKILALDLGNEDDWKIAQYLGQPGKLIEHSAKRVKSLSPGSEKMPLGDRLDELLTLSDSQLMAMVPKSKQTAAGTRGKMLAAIIEKEVK